MNAPQDAFLVQRCQKAALPVLGKESEVLLCKLLVVLIISVVRAWHWNDRTVESPLLAFHGFLAILRLLDLAFLPWFPLEIKYVISESNDI